MQKPELIQELIKLQEGRTFFLEERDIFYAHLMSMCHEINITLWLDDTCEPPNIKMLSASTLEELFDKVIEHLTDPLTVTKPSKVCVPVEIQKKDEVLF